MKTPVALYSLFALIQLSINSVLAATIEMKVTIHKVPRLDVPSLFDPTGKSDPYIQIWLITHKTKHLLYKSATQKNKLDAVFLVPYLTVPDDALIQIDVHDKDLAVDDPIGFLFLNVRHLMYVGQVGGPMICGRKLLECGSMYVEFLDTPGYLQPSAPPHVAGYAYSQPPPAAVYGHNPAAAYPPPAAAYPHPPAAAAYPQPPPAGYPPPPPAGYPPPPAAGYSQPPPAGYASSWTPHSQPPPAGYASSWTPHSHPPPAAPYGHQHTPLGGALHQWIYGHAAPIGGYHGFPRAGDADGRDPAIQDSLSGDTAAYPSASEHWAPPHSADGQSEKTTYLPGDELHKLKYGDADPANEVGDADGRGPVI